LLRSVYPKAASSADLERIGEEPARRAVALGLDISTEFVMAAAIVRAGSTK